MYPKLLKASDNSETASSGNAVPNAPTCTDPPILGFAAVTFSTLDMFFPPNM